MPDNPYLDLRDRALNAGGMDLEHRSGAHPNVSGVVIDIPSGREFATLVALSDGATSLYTSVGGGTIGAGEHESVAAATSTLLEEVEAELDVFPASEETGHPGREHVRLFVLATDGRRLVDLPEDQFWTPGAGVIPDVVSAAQDVMAAIRELGDE